MSNYIVSDSDLASVADAIREKGETSGQLLFPSGFVTAIQDIETGGASPWTLIKTQENTVSTTSTSAASAFTIALSSANYTKDKIIWVHIRDKDGKQAGYFFGSDAFFINYYKADGATSALSTPAVLCLRYTTASALAATAGQYGVYGYSINSSGTLTVRRRYNSNYSLTINGTYVTEVYSLDPPSGVSLF